MKSGQFFYLEIVYICSSYLNTCSFEGVMNFRTVIFIIDWKFLLDGCNGVISFHFNTFSNGEYISVLLIVASSASSLCEECP